MNISTQKDTRSPSAPATLYARLGGASAIAATVDQFYQFVLADSELQHFFNDVDIEWVKTRQSQFFTTALGGPPMYKGPSLDKSHAHLAIEQRHFDLVAGHLITTLQNLGISPSLIAEVVALIAPLAPQLVNTSTYPRG